MKNLLILGDSYSTFKGYIPDGYKTYYPSADVTSAEKTWWHILSKELGLSIAENNSWSGSTVSYTGREGDCSSTSSFIYRFELLAKSGFLKEREIDTVFVFGATNDSWTDVPLGRMGFDNITREDLYDIRPAICKLALRIREELPSARVVFIVNDELKDEIDATFIAAAEHCDAEVVLLENIDKTTGHPTALGMQQIAAQMKKALLDKI